MNRKPSLRLTVPLAMAAAAAVALLSGCGGATPGPTGANPPPAQSSVAAPPASSPKSSEPSPESSEPGDSASKPPKEDVLAGIVKYYTKEANMPAARAQKLGKCLVDEMYDKAKAKTLIGFRDGKLTQLDSSDISLWSQANEKCIKEVTS